MILQPAQQGSEAPPVVLTIAGFDPSSGAGITADLQVFAAHALFGVSAITALTVQSTLGVASVQPLDPELLRHTLEHLVDDIQPAGIKIGMLGTAANVRVVAEFLRSRIRCAGERIPVVLDPVIRSSSGAALLDEQGVSLLREELLALVDWVTPNQAELGTLTNRVIGHTRDALDAAEALAAGHPHLHCIITRGDAEGTPIDLWRAPDSSTKSFQGERIQTRSTHGTGCAFSSALLCRLVQGQEPADAIGGAKAYVEGALRYAPGIGQGNGPMNLLWLLRQARD